MGSAGAWILGLGSALPPYSLSQDGFLEIILQAVDFESELEEKARKIFRNSAIHKRYSVLFDRPNPSLQDSAFTALASGKSPGMGLRNEMYKLHAPPLARAAAEATLDSWGGKREAITHVISVSCTGVLAPGIEFLLIDQLGLSRQVSRIGLNFMGCFGALRALVLAQALAKEDPKNRILLVCTELCTLHFQTDARMDTIVGNALFADGAAGVVIGATPNEGESPQWEIHRHHSWALPASLEEMTWEAGDHGYEMRLSHRIPQALRAHIGQFASELAGERIDPTTSRWALHPGGKAIIHSVGTALGLSPEQLLPTRKILAECGNLSSASILFVLEELGKGLTSPEWTLGVGFGPGLSIEGTLLRAVKP